MIKATNITNFGPLGQLSWQGLGNINLVIGGNGTGKTFLLKALYTGIRTLEEYKRGDVQSSAAEILADKLYWTFQPETIGHLVRNGADAPLAFQMQLWDHEFRYSFGRGTTKQINTIENYVPPRANNSIFLPAKEVLSLHGVILKSRDDDKVFGFDDTYYDLAKALRQLPTGGKNFAEFAQARADLAAMLSGKVQLNTGAGRWYFNRADGGSYPMGVTAEGVKKIAILETLLGNRYLDLNSVVFIDELESALHPSAISKTIDIILMLAQRGIQFFIASHSYFVVKKLFLVAQEAGISIPVISAEGNEWMTADLKDGMPENSIIAESVRLYEEQVNLALS